tara:strand:+ start:383 stop:655 length:273 start_codon:yes stop_codon:yes gene_type:complete
MINYFNNIITFILWLDFLDRYFPNESFKIKKVTLNNLILIYSYLEIKHKQYISTQEPTSYILSDNVEELEKKSFNKEIIDIFNKYKEKEK